MIHLAPPAWTMTDSNAEPRHDELTALIGELSESERFDHRLSEEFRRLQSGTQDLAQAAPETMELAPLDKLAPPPDVLLQQAPGATAQPQQAGTADMKALPPAPYRPSQTPGATAQPKRVPTVQPPQQIQPQQALCAGGPGCEGSFSAQPVTKGKITR